MCGCLSHTTYWGPGLQLRHVPETGNRTSNPLIPRPALNHWATHPGLDLPVDAKIPLLGIYLKIRWDFFSFFFIIQLQLSLFTPTITLPCPTQPPLSTFNPPWKTKHFRRNICTSSSMFSVCQGPEILVHGLALPRGSCPMCIWWTGKTIFNIYPFSSQRLTLHAAHAKH